MDAPRTMLVVTGSRSLGAHAERTDWAQAQIVDATRYLRPDDVVLSGRAPGPANPDTWARELALYRKIEMIEFALDGYRWRNDVRTEKTWWQLAVDAGGGGMKVPLARNCAVVEAARLTATAGWNVWTLGLVDPKSETHGTGQTLDRARRAGLQTLGLVYGAPDMLLADHPWFAPGRVRAASVAPDLLALDTETTGRDAAHCAVIDVGMIRLDPTATYVREQFATRIAIPPWAVVEIEAIRTNGYTSAKWAGAPDAEDVFGALATAPIFKGRPRLLGHNVGFDRRFVLAMFARCGLAAPALRVPDEDIDTLPLTREWRKRNGMPGASNKLGDICGVLGIPTDDGHEALPDAARAVEVYRRLRGHPDAPPYAARP